MPDENEARLRRVAMHDAVDGVWLATMVRRIMMPVSQAEDAGVHNEYVTIIGDLIPVGKIDDACHAIAKSILEIARSRNA